MNDKTAGSADGLSDGPLSRELVTRITAALGFVEEVPVDFDGLSQLYAAWCACVPFDNIRKMIALRSPDTMMPGLDASDFFENWIANGSGGTCWPSSNALCVLLMSLGFDARRVAGSMFDIPDINHGTVKVKIEGRDWMVDSSMLTYRPLPITSEVFVNDDPAHRVEVEPSNGSHVVWRDFPPLSEYIPCRLRLDPVDTDFYFERYEKYSREQSPFNDRLYFRRGGPHGTFAVFGNVRFRRTAEGLDVHEFTREGLLEFLRDEAAVSEVMLESWVESGALDSTFVPSDNSHPEIRSVRPSMRIGADRLL
jgi:N-hydroxyarylamine O-acetyltransferase